MATTEEQKILDIKVKYEDAIYGIIRYKEKIEELKASIETLKQQEKDGSITRNEYKLQTEAINVSMTQYKDTMRVLRKEMQNNLRQEQFQEGSLKSLRAELSNATKAYDELSRAERNAAKGKELQQHIKDITRELKLAEEGTDRFHRNVGNYYNSMLDLAEDLQHVVPMGGGGGVGEFTNSIASMATTVTSIIPKIGAFKASLVSLVSSPIFAALAGVAGAGMAFKWFYDYNKGLLQATRLTREFTGYTGEALETMRNSIAATADAMGKDFNEVLSTADALMAQYHLSGEQAMKVINDGFASGADLSGDMLSKIQQYAPTFHDAGISADQLVAILQQTRSGIFSDKGMDLITMASKKIREMSTATASSLDAIGISSQQVQKDLQNGTKNTFDVIQEVATKMKNFGADSKEVGAVLKDVFGKQGAAAGLQLIEQLDTMSTDLEEVKKQTGAWGKVQEENIALQKELNSYMSSMFDFSQKGFGSIITAGKQFGTKVLIQILKGLFNVINYFIDWYNDSVLLRIAITSLGLQFKALWTVVKTVCNLIIDAFKQIGRSARGVLTLLEGVVTLDYDKAMQGLRGIFDIGPLLKEGWGDLKKAGMDMAQSVVDGYNATIGNAKLEHLKLANVDGGATSADPTKGNGNGKPTADTTKNDKQTKAQKAAADKAAKEEAEKRKQQEKQLQAAIALINFQYNEKVMDAKKRYLAGMYDSEVDYKNELDALEKDMIARSLDAYVQAGQIGADKAQEMQEKLLDIMIKAKEDIKNQAKEIVDTINKEFEDSEKARSDANILGGGTSNDESDNTAKLERYKAFLEQKLALAQTNTEAQKQLQQQLHDVTIQLQEDENEKKRKAEEEQLQNLKNYILAVGDAFEEFFNSEDKSFRSFLKSLLTNLLDAIEKAMLAQYVAILGGDLVKLGWAGVASAAAKMALITAAFGAAKAAVKSFAVGGYVSGEGTGTSDSIPARLSNGESVMTAKATSMFSPILSAFNQLGGGVPIVVNNGQSQIGMDMLAAAVAKGYTMAPRPVVSVEEINRTQRRVETIETLGKI